MPIGASKVGALGGLVPGGSETFNTSGTFSVPPGVKLVSITGAGGAGNPGTPGTSGNAGNPGTGGGGGGGGATTNDGTSPAAARYRGGHGGGVWWPKPCNTVSQRFGCGTGAKKSAWKSGCNSNAPPFTGTAGQTGATGLQGNAGCAGSPGCSGQQSTGLSYTFCGGDGGAAGNAGNRGNAGTGGSGGNGGGGAPQPVNTGFGGGGNNNTGGGAGAPGRPGGACGKGVGGGGGGGAGATNPGAPNPGVPGPQPGRGGISFGGSTCGYSFPLRCTANLPNQIVQRYGTLSTAMTGGTGGLGESNSQGGWAADVVGSPSQYADGVFRTDGDTPGWQASWGSTNPVIRSGSGGGAGAGEFPPESRGTAGGGGGGGRGNAGNAGGCGGAGGCGQAATPTTYNCVPVTPGGCYPIVVGAPGGQVVISWNPQ